MTNVKSMTEKYEIAPKYNGLYILIVRMQNKRLIYVLKFQKG